MSRPELRWNVPLPVMSAEEIEAFLQGLTDVPAGREFVVTEITDRGAILRLPVGIAHQRPGR
jgi:hypothetical protein